MAIEIYVTTSPIIAADAACDVQVPGIPSSYVDDDEDTEEEGQRNPSLLSIPELTGWAQTRGLVLWGPAGTVTCRALFHFQGGKNE